jgi:hypothetical protein
MERGTRVESLLLVSREIEGAVSPITWGPHCVALLAACYLCAALKVVRDRLPGWALVVLCVYIFFCSLLGRDLIGRNLSLRLETYHITTFCILGPMTQSERY